MAANKVFHRVLFVLLDNELGIRIRYLVLLHHVPSRCVAEDNVIGSKVEIVAVEL